MADQANPNANLPVSRNPDMKGYGNNFGPVPQLTYGMTFREVGSYGLRAFGGYVREEFLPQLQGRQGTTVYREMGDNSPVIGGMIFAIQSTMRKVQWRVTAAADTPEAMEAAEFVEGVMDDMAETWEDVIADGLSMVQYGYAPMELCYKRRLGHDPGTMPLRPAKKLPRSKFDDGMIAWDKIAIRGQDTVFKWFFDDDGDWLGLTQQPYLGPLLDVPREKLLLFRPSQHKNNPEGRALDPSTPIPTINGWKLLEDVCVGDAVFDERGRVCYVQARADWHDRPAYKVTFADGSEIIADANHEWSVRWAKRPDGGSLIRTTEELANSRLLTEQGAALWSIDRAKPLQYAQQELLVDPYCLGAWLGDGSTSHGDMCSGRADFPEMAASFEAAGYRVVVQEGRGDEGTAVFGAQGTKPHARDGLRSRLLALGLLDNKHIPAAYLKGSIAQRLALLQGLMDSDGSVSPSGYCVFANNNYQLAAGVAELVRSLGGEARIQTVEPREGGIVGERTLVSKKTVFRVNFTPTFSAFRLGRKLARVKSERSRDRHYIRSIEPVSSRRTICIEVDSPSHLFLAGEGMVPTHNSVLRNAYRSYFMVKRLEEQEAILFERLGGIPVIKMPGAVLQAAQDGDAQAIATVEGMKRIAMNLRIDEQMGVVFPSDVYENQNGAGSQPMYSLELVSPGGGKGGGSAADSNAIIVRHNNSMMMSTLADFLMLGHGPNGTEALADSKKGMFFQGVEGYLNSMAAVINNDGLTRLWDLNALDHETKPMIEPDLAQELDLDILGNFINRLATSGMAVFPNAALEAALMDAAGLPDINDPTTMGLIDEAADDPAAIVGPYADAKSEELAPTPAPVIAPGAPGSKEPFAPGSPTEKLYKLLQGSIARRVIQKQGNTRNIDTRRAPVRRSSIAK